MSYFLAQTTGVDTFSSLRYARDMLQSLRIALGFKLLLVVLLLSGFALLISQIDQMQQVKNFAQTPAPTGETLPGDPATYNVNVLAIGFNPVQGASNAADLYFGANGTNSMGGRTAAQNEDYIFNSAIDSFKRISGGKIQYHIARKLTITSFPKYTNGYTFTLENYKECVYGTPAFNPTKCEQQKVAFDHNAWLTTNRICEIANEVAADEVWVVSLPYVMRWESFMFGPKDTFSVNADPISVPQCTKNYILMDATYDSPDNLLHIYGHRIEAVMNYLTQPWRSADATRYWRAFASMGRYETPTQPYTSPTCGNAHWPANASGEYDYENLTTKSFTCPDWKNFPELTGATEIINCTAWGCTDRGWQEHWFGALPRSEGEVSMVSVTDVPFSFRKNWWYYILYPEHAIAQRKRELTAPSPTPTRRPTATPTKVAPQTVTLYPTADATVRSDQKTTNFGRTSTLIADSDLIGISYIRFDLSQLAGKTILSANLKLKVSNGSVGKQRVRKVSNTTWSERTITYANKPTLGTTVRNIGPLKTGTQTSIDVLSYVKTQAGKLMSLGIDNLDPDGIVFYSANGTVVANKPVLIVTYQ